MNREFKAWLTTALIAGSASAYLFFTAPVRAAENGVGLYLLGSKTVTGGMQIGQ